MSLRVGAKTLNDKNQNGLNLEIQNYQRLNEERPLLQMTEVSNKNLRTRCRKEFKSKINIRMVCAGSSERSCKRKLKKKLLFFEGCFEGYFFKSQFI